MMTHQQMRYTFVPRNDIISYIGYAYVAAPVQKPIFSAINRTEIQAFKDFELELDPDGTPSNDQESWVWFCNFAVVGIIGISHLRAVRSIPAPKQLILPRPRAQLVCATAPERAKSLIVPTSACARAYVRRRKRARRPRARATRARGSRVRYARRRVTRAQLRAAFRAMRLARYRLCRT